MYSDRGHSQEDATADICRWADVACTSRGGASYEASMASAAAFKHAAARRSSTRRRGVQARGGAAFKHAAARRSSTRRSGGHARGAAADACGRDCGE
jgi:hypothetical protein